MAKRKLRVGMIGAGGISHLHCEGWTKLPDCELVAITDVNRDAALKRAEEFHIETVEASAKRLVARKDLDVIDIVTPNRLHKEQTLMSLRAGKHVLCEKPLGLNPQEVDQMIAAAEKAKRKLMCAQHMRFEDRSVALKRYVAAGNLGEIYYARAWYNRRRGLPTWGSFLYHDKQGGGCCIDVGVHILDLAMFLMDNFDPISVSGISVTKIAKRKEAWSAWGDADYDKKGMDVEDFAAGMIRFANGAALSLECSFMLNMKGQNDNRVELFGVQAGVKWPDCEIYSHTEHDFLDSSISVRESKTRAHHNEIKAFAEAILGNRPAPVPPEQTRAVMAALAGLYKSQETGREVRL